MPRRPREKCSLAFRRTTSNKPRRRKREALTTSALVRCFQRLLRATPILQLGFRPWRKSQLLSAYRSWPSVALRSRISMLWPGLVPAQRRPLLLSSGQPIEPPLAEPSRERSAKVLRTDARVVLASLDLHRQHELEIVALGKAGTNGKIRRQGVAFDDAKLVAGIRRSLGQRAINVGG